MSTININGKTIELEDNQYTPFHPPTETTAQAAAPTSAALNTSQQTSATPQTDVNQRLLDMINQNKGTNIGGASQSSEPTIGSLFGEKSSGSPYEDEMSAYRKSLEFDPNKIRSDILRGYQGEIDSIKNVYASLLKEQQLQGQGRIGETTATSSRRGLLGSTFGTQALEGTRGLNLKNEQSVLESQAAAIANVMSRANAAANQEIAARRAAKAGGTASYLEYLKDEPNRRKTKAVNYANLLLGQGLDPFDPSVRAQLEEALSGKNLGISTQDILNAYFENKPEEVIPEGYTLSEGQARYDADGNRISYNPKTYKPDDGGSGGSGSVSDSLLYADEKAKRTVASIDQLILDAKDNPGIFGRSAAIPMPDAMRTDAYRDFKAQLSTLRANIAFGELTEMRNASKTGGALGQVSNIELGLLESALGALEMSQTAEGFQTQLNKIKESIQNWNQAKKENAGDVAVAETTSQAPTTITAPDGTQVIIVD